jgi:hypothetical protein
MTMMALVRNWGGGGEETGGGEGGKEQGPLIKAEVSADLLTLPTFDLTL